MLNEVTYTYKIQAVRRLGDEMLASLDSPTQIAMPVKRTPPPPVQWAWWWPPPGGGTAVGAKSRRRRGGLPGLPAGTGEEKSIRLTPKLITKPYFVDAQVQRGRTYYYYVTAVDDTPRANESLPSETMPITY